MSGFFRFECKVISRKGKTKTNSSLNAASYISGKTIKAASYISGQEDYSHKKGVLDSWIILNKKAPKEWENPSQLWNSVENVEKGANADLFREFIICFDKHLNYEEMIEVANKFGESLIAEGIPAVHMAIHDEKSNNGNFHVHMLCPTRGLNDDGTWQTKKTYPRKYALDADGQRIPIIDNTTGGQKIYKGRKQWQREPLQYINSWNDKKNNNVTRWRKVFCDIENKYLPPEYQVTPKSYKEQGINKIPGIHLSKSEYELQKKFNKIINSLSATEKEQLLSVLEKVIIEDYKRTQYRHFSFINMEHLQIAKQLCDIISYYNDNMDSRYIQQNVSEEMLIVLDKLSHAKNDLILSFIYKPTRQTLINIKQFQLDMKKQQLYENKPKRKKHHIHK